MTDHIYSLIVAEIRTTRRRGYVPNLDSITNSLKAELERDIQAGRFSEREATEMLKALEIARERAKCELAYI